MCLSKIHKIESRGENQELRLHSINKSEIEHPKFEIKKPSYLFHLPLVNIFPLVTQWAFAGYQLKIFMEAHQVVKTTLKAYLFNAQAVFYQ